MKTVPFERCFCGKRGWSDQSDAEKALGRSRTARNRKADKMGTRRGIVRENRVYACHEGDLLHLTSQSKRENNVQMGEVAPVAVLTWETFLEVAA